VLRNRALQTDIYLLTYLHLKLKNNQTQKLALAKTAKELQSDGLVAFYDHETELAYSYNSRVQHMV